MNDYNEILEIIEYSYIDGIHRKGDRKMIERSFHPEFSMFLKEKDGIRIMRIQEWITMIEDRKSINPKLYEDRNVSHTVNSVQIHKSFATILLDLFIDDKLYAVDHFSLYKLNGEWKIMAKVYHM